MREIAIIAFSQTPNRRKEMSLNESEMLAPVVAELLKGVGLSRTDVDFTCSGSSDWVAGYSFSWVTAMDALGAWPPIIESHVEGEAAWALYEAWVKMLCHEEIEVSLVYGFGRQSMSSPREVMVLMNDPYLETPLWPDTISQAALQARALLDAGLCTERDFAEIAARNLRHAQSNPLAQLSGHPDPDDLLEAPTIASPLRKHDCPPITDGACAVLLAAGDRARALCQRPAWIKGLAHRIDVQSLGRRDLTRSQSARLAAEAAGAIGGQVDIAELHAPFTPQDWILQRELELSNGTVINPSGGVHQGNPMMGTGLVRFGEVAARIINGEADRGIAHGTQGPCLQQNIIGLMGGE
jgi:acetyl-CoA acetyltransferase